MLLSRSSPCDPRPRSRVRSARRGRLQGRLLAAALLSAGLGGVLRAGTIHVFPDPGNGPIAAAVAQLQDGDRLILNAGTYDERLTLVDLSKVKVIGKGEVVFEGVGPSATISVTDCDRVQLRGLTVLDAPTQGLLVNGCDKVVIRDCAVEQHGTQGLQISASTQVKVTKCSVRGGTYGIYVSGASTAKLVANTVTDPSAQGIFLVLPELPGTRIVRNTVSGSGNAGIEVDGPGNAVVRNEVSDCLFGIVTAFTAGDMSGSSIARNTVSDTLVALRAYASGGLELAANTVVAAGASAVQIASQAEGVVVTRTKVDGADSGIDDEGTGSLVSRNTLAGTALYGIRARGEAGHFERNRVFDTAGDGFRVWSGGNTFARNKASGNAGVDLSSQVAEDQNAFEKNSFGTTSFPE